MEDAWHKPIVMENAAIGRALLADADLVPEALERLKECDCWLSTYGVTRALAWAGDVRAVDPLLEILRDTDRSEAERALAADALGWIADKDILPWDARISVGVNYVAATPTLSDPTGYGILDVL